MDEATHLAELMAAIDRLRNLLRDYIDIDLDISTSSPIDLFYPLKKSKFSVAKPRQPSLPKNSPIAFGKTAAFTLANNSIVSLNELKHLSTGTISSYRKTVFLA
ncbi:hypothetical protein [Baaleninema simplex]|uniref:hypothetical protein n=1 Tax=Baaleninema simplex TaxID=2862350 RepID=UPI00034D3884|nr:hypothetical protein [Baaleninema simplex]